MTYTVFDIKVFAVVPVAFFYRHVAEWTALSPSRARVAVRSIANRYPEARFEVTRHVIDTPHEGDDIDAAEVLDIIDRESR
jgi:hypothetical protein